MKRYARRWLAFALAAAAGAAGLILISGVEDLPPRGEALALFEEVSAQVYPWFRNVLAAPPQIKVRDMTSRWDVGHPAKGVITLALRLAAQERAAVEYVVLHEYAHFVRADHSPAFWAVVARYMPDYKARRRLLAPSVQGGMESPEGPPPTY